MKKIILLFTIILLSTTVVNAHPYCQNSKGCPPPTMNRPAPQKIDLDKKLNLTEEQKIKAKEIRMNGHKQIKPLLEELKTKQEQKRALMNSQINKKEQIEYIDKLNTEIITLKRKIHEVRVNNNKEFESILTDKQLKTLEKIKTDARKDFKKHHRRFSGARPCNCPRR